jgi:ABC-type phosphate/phosphonate transport system substrate-binding protein
METGKPIVVGAVIYDPKVTVIWKIIRDFFEEAGCPIDVVFYSNYALQVDGLVKGHLDVAWNSPLAWLDALRRTGGRCRAVAMRDTDRDRVSRLVVKKGGGVTAVSDLRGKTIAFGAKDSPQATLIPIEWLARQGLAAGAGYEARRFDVLVGLHGDHVGGERDAFACLARGEAAASWMLDMNWDAWTRDGTVDAAAFAVLASTDPFDHCNFTVREEFDRAREERFTRALFSMTYDNPKHREMMDMEGLKAWEPGRTTGYAALGRAVVDQRFFEDEAR